MRGLRKYIMESLGVEDGLLGGQGLLHLVAGVDQEDGGVCGLQRKF